VATGRLLGYTVVNGKPFVLVPWYPTWEAPDEIFEGGSREGQKTI
jgi:hypothetical protein